MKGVIAIWNPRRRLSMPPIAAPQYPNRVSRGPFGRGTRNHTSKMRKAATGTPTATSRIDAHLWRPIHRMYAAR